MPSPITISLWFNGEASTAAEFYTSIFKDSAIHHTQYYSSAGQEVHGHEPGSVLLVEFSLNGQRFSAMNGGPQFTHSEAVSFRIEAEDQAELDHFWEKLGEGGDPEKQKCGWLRDKFGVSWQVTPKALGRLLGGGDKAKSQKAMAALMGMKKIDIAALEAAYEG